MKPKSLLVLLLLLPALSYCQTIITPAVGYSEDRTTTIAKVDVTENNTVVTFKHIMRGKGNWVQLNKSMYLQDAKGEERYNYIKSQQIFHLHNSENKKRLAQNNMRNKQLINEDKQSAWLKLPVSIAVWLY